MSSYYSEWYKKNKKRVSEQRQERYQNDPCYRRELVEYQREYKKRNKGREKDGRSTFFISKGKEIEVFTIGKLERALNKKSTTIGYWVRSGILPETPFVTDGGHRLYTQEMIDIV